MRAIGYVRVSTEEQSREGVSLEMQAEKIRQYCALNDLELVGIVRDAGISAKNINGRPGFKSALEKVFSEEADALVVWKLDRAFRSTKDALAVAEQMNAQKKGLHSISEKLDTQSAVGEFFFTLMASLAQMERKLIGERTKAALDSKRNKGERVGQIPYGYALAEDGITLIEDAEEQHSLSDIRILHDRGYGMRRIADELNHMGIRTKKGRLWTHTQIHRLLKERKDES